MIRGLLAGLDVTRWLVYGALIASAVSVVWSHGYFNGKQKLYEYQAEQARAAVPVVVAQGKVTERVVVKYRDRVVKVQAETQVIEKEIVRYVPPSADCVLPAGWMQLHDAAATRTVPAPAAGIDVTAPAIAASQALKGVVDNYGACHVIAEQLSSLQEWVRFQYETQNHEQLSY